MNDGDRALLAALTERTLGKIEELQEAVYIAYADLWGHHRALIHAVSALGGGLAERLETDAAQWFAEHHEAVIGEARDRLAMMMGKKTPPPV